MGLLQVNAAAEVIYDLVDPSANLIFGAVVDPTISGQVSDYFVSHTRENKVAAICNNLCYMGSVRV